MVMTTPSLSEGDGEGMAVISANISLPVAPGALGIYTFISVTLLKSGVYFI